MRTALSRVSHEDPMTGKGFIDLTRAWFMSVTAHSTIMPTNLVVDQGLALLKKWEVGLKWLTLKGLTIVEEV